MKTAELVIKSAYEFYGELQKDKNGRYHSWEYCYLNFGKARKETNPDLDYLSLQLAFYLASWGMYRGSSFLLQKDYKVHIPVIEELLKEKYDFLFGIDCEHILLEENQKLLEELSTFALSYYDAIRREVKGNELKNDVSETLITKLLMGTMGCVPAYDRYFVSGIKAHKIAVGSYKTKSIVQLAKFYQENFEALEEARKNLVVGDMLYPQMKLIDMGFWQIGDVVEREKKNP